MYGGVITAMFSEETIHSFSVLHADAKLSKIKAPAAERQYLFFMIWFRLKEIQKVELNLTSVNLPVIIHHDAHRSGIDIQTGNNLQYSYHTIT